MRADTNLFILKPICIKSTRVGSWFYATLLWSYAIKFIERWKCMLIGEKVFQWSSSQDTASMLSKLKYVREFCFLFHSI